MRFEILVGFLAVASVGHDALAQKAQPTVLAEATAAVAPEPQSLAQFVFDTIDQVGLQESLAVPEQYRNSDQFFPIVEDEPNKLGFAPIAAEKLEEGIAVLAIHAE